MDLRQAYKILEIPENASMQEVKQAHRDLAQIWHPDRQPQNERLQKKALEKMKDLNAAYDCICSHLKAKGFTDDESKHKDSGERTIICPQCGAKNRIPSSINDSGAKCGKCGSYLFREQHKKEPETEERKSWISCGDGACIGHIDSTGKCRKCGKTYEEGIVAEKDRAERRGQQQAQENSRSRGKKRIIYVSVATGLLVLFLLMINSSKSPSGKGQGLQNLPVQGSASPSRVEPLPVTPSKKLEIPIALVTASPNRLETDATSNTGRIRLLDKYLGQHPRKIFKAQAIVKKFKSLLGNKYDSFINNLSVSDSLKRKGDFYFASGCAPHACGDEEAAFAINARSGDIYVMNLINMYKQLDARGTTNDLPAPLIEWYGKRVQ